MSIRKTGYKFSALSLIVLLMFSAATLADDGDKNIELTPIGNYGGGATDTKVDKAEDVVALHKIFPVPSIPRLRSVFPCLLPSGFGYPFTM